jgi:uncharacterized membrane protein
MSAPIPAVEPSTVQTTQDPNSITNLIKNVQEQNKQAKSDTQFDSKVNMYESFQDLNGTRVLSIGASFLIAAGILSLVGALVGKKGRR